ncbi:MAG: NUDIX domain-containing protein [Proteobacteria bacterium]|nr:NUDIX domain-containing protein [Pseudomonadota bacterium]
MEFLEIVDWDSGLKSGRYVNRTTAHQQGKPHEAVHIWVFTEIEGKPSLLFQQRAQDKPNFPGLLDATVGGHFKAGESLVDVLREAREEINLDVDIEELNFVERHQMVLETDRYKDFEWIDEYFIYRDQPLGEYRFPDGEVIGLAGIYLDDLKELQQNRVEMISVHFLGADQKTARKQIDRSAIVPHHFKDNFISRLLDQFIKFSH